MCEARLVSCWKITSFLGDSETRGQIFNQKALSIRDYSIRAFQKCMRPCTCADTLKDLRAAQIPGELVCGLPQKKILGPGRRRKNICGPVLAEGKKRKKGPYFSQEAKKNCTVPHFAQDFPCSCKKEQNFRSAGSLLYAASTLGALRGPFRGAPAGGRILPSALVCVSADRSC